MPPPVPVADFLPPLKVLLIGPSGAGKSALLLRYFDDKFDPDSATATIGIDFRSKNLSVSGTHYRLTVFDTAGQERFRTLSTSFYRGAQGVILVYDISSRASFLAMDKWFEEAKANAVKEAVLYLVGTKLDKAERGGREVSTDEGWALAEAQGAAGFCEASAKARVNCRAPFLEVVDRIAQSPSLLEVAKARRAPTVAVADTHGDGDGSLTGCSC